MKCISSLPIGIMAAMVLLSCSGKQNNPTPQPDRTGKITTDLNFLPAFVSCIPKSIRGNQDFNENYNFVSCSFKVIDDGGIGNQINLVPAPGLPDPSRQYYYGAYYCGYKNDAVVTTTTKITLEGQSRVIFKPTGETIDLSPATIELTVYPFPPGQGSPAIDAKP